jgi:hypothetical protein
MNRAYNLGTRPPRWIAASVISILISISFTPRLAWADGGDTDSRRSTQEVAPPPQRVVMVTDPSNPPRVVVVSDPRVIRDWQEGEPVPPGYHPAQRMRKGSIVAGAVTFGVLYFISVLVAAAGTDVANASRSSNDLAGLFVPVIGPFITMTKSSTAMGDVVLVMDGLGQTAGAILLVYGLTQPQTVLVRDAKFSPPPLLPRPILLGKQGAGLGLVGTF